MADRTLYVDAGATGANNGTSPADAYTSLASALTGSPGATDIYRTYVKGYPKGAHDYVPWVPAYAGHSGYEAQWYFNCDWTLPAPYVKPGGGGAIISGLSILTKNTNFVRVKGHYNVYKAIVDTGLTLRSVFANNVLYSSGLPIKFLSETIIPYEREFWNYFYNSTSGAFYLCVPPEYSLTDVQAIEIGYANNTQAASVGSTYGYHKVQGGIFIGGYSSAPIVASGYVELNKVISYGGFGTGAVLFNNAAANNSKLTSSLLLNRGKTSTNGLVYCQVGTGYKIYNNVFDSDTYAIQLAANTSATVRNNKYFGIATQVYYLSATATLTESNNEFDVKTKKFAKPGYDATVLPTLTAPVLNNQAVDYIVVYDGATYTNATNGAITYPTGVNNRVYFGCKDQPFSGLNFTVTTPGAGYTSISWLYPTVKDWTSTGTLASTGGTGSDGMHSGTLYYADPTNWSSSFVNGIYGWWICLNVGAYTAGNATGGVTVSVASGNANPRFLDFEELKFKTLGGDPGTNKGTDVSLTTDFDGNAVRGLPDIGAYEYQGGGGGLNLELGIEI